jgi:hypothetical protein
MVVMFDSSLLTKLQADTVLVSCVNTYVTDSRSVPAIFSEYAPETANMPYIVFSIQQMACDNLAVSEFVVFIEYFDFNKSLVNTRKAAERLEYVLDRAVLEHERFGYIRMNYYNGFSVNEDDARKIHYRMQFTARGGRKKWSATTT